MTPINAQFNTALFMLNALNSVSSSNTFSAFDNSVFGGFSSFNTFGSMTPSFNVFGFLSNFKMPAMNFNFSSTTTTQMPTFNFGSFGTNVSTRLTSNRAQNAVSLATSQIGVRENGSSNDSIDIRRYKNGSKDANPWCASFVSWCYGRGQNGNNSKTFGYDASTQSIRAKAMRAGKYSSKDSGYVPQVGDIAMWRYSSSSGHVGIVSKVNPDGSFETIEGNCDNKVQRVTRTRSANGFDGFVRMNEWLQA